MKDESKLRISNCNSSLCKALSNLFLIKLFIFSSVVWLKEGVKVSQSFELQCLIHSLVKIAKESKFLEFKSYSLHEFLIKYEFVSSSCECSSYYFDQMRIFPQIFAEHHNDIRKEVDVNNLSKFSVLRA